MSEKETFKNSAAEIFDSWRKRNPVKVLNGNTIEPGWTVTGASLANDPEITVIKIRTRKVMNYEHEEITATKVVKQSELESWQK